MSVSFDELDLDPPENLRRVDAWGMVIEAGRGSLPFALVHGEPLVACAAWSLGAAGVSLVDLGTPWADLADDGRPLVLADPLCPLTPPDFVVECVEVSTRTGAVVVGVRAVTDTVKLLDPAPYVGANLERDTLVQVVSPVVLPAAVVEALGAPSDVSPGLPSEALLGGDIAELVAALAARFPVRTVAAPPSARRVADVADLTVLEALTSSTVPVAD